ncbi:hypothetical protein NCIMB2158_330038 [Tenacibaculum maritimum]|uniref:hypothetical protein n=1 Tax=Tenacibaculum maritimum TaxID=107401 RepID=UPI0012E3FABB|nr:hypothetical protein [Tenacibaculum maritimum]CAA0208351.1 hypothetical protein NCIMB2158_330038 [Tenacibaculum maritimum]
MNSLLKELEVLKRRIETIRSEDKSNYDNDYKKHLSIEESVYRQLVEKIEYQILSPSEKQSERILNLTKSREQNKDVTDQLNEINLYSKIREVIPYAMAVSYKINMEKKHLTEDLLSFCEEQLETIDSSPYKRKVTFPSKEEVEKAFKSYTQRIKPNRIPVLKAYKQPEVNKKIEELYQMFLSLAQ